MSTRIEVFDYSVDAMSALLWQFNDAVRLQKIIELKQLWYNENQANFWENWERDVFDLRTANSFGLSVWAIILDVPLTFGAPASDPGKIGWGFGSQRKNFNNGNFKRRSAGTITLTLNQQRLILQLRYFQLTTSGNVLEINQFLGALFREEFGRVYVRDNLDMTASYIFRFYPSSDFQAVLDNFDLLPRPTGVKLNYLIIPEDNYPFGFENHGTFDNSNFWAELPPPVVVLALDDGSLLTTDDGSLLKLI